MNLTRRFVLVNSLKVCAASPLLAYGASHAAAASALQREPLATLPPSYREESLAISDDAQSVAFAAGAGGSERVVHDGQEGPVFSRCSNPVFAPTSKKLFYSVLDGSPGGRRLKIMADGTLIDTDFASEPEFFFSPDGKHWAASGSMVQQQQGNTIRRGKVILFVDGVEVGRYNDASAPTFSRDGNHVAFLASDDDVTLIVDGKPETIFKSDPATRGQAINPFVNGSAMDMAYQCKYLSDGSLLLLVPDGSSWTIYKGPKAIKSYAGNTIGGFGYRGISSASVKSKDGIAGRSVVTALDSPVAIWWEKMEGDQAKRWRLVKDGQPIDDNLATDWWSSQRPVISNDGSRCGYVLWDDPDISAVINGTKSAPFKNVWGITLPSAAERGRFKSAFAASDGSEWSFVVNGTPDSAKFTSAYAPTIAIDGSHLVCRAKRDNSQWLVVDQVAVDGVQNVISGPMFLNRSMQVNPAAPTNVIWVVQEGKELFRVTSSL